MDSEYAAAYPKLYREHWWWRARERILLRKIAKLLPARRRARILDVGCGAGLFLSALERYGHVEGIESDAVSVERAGRWRSRIHLGELDDASLPPASFDLLLMLDVIEHVREPGRLLKRASELLSAEGRLLVTVPAFQWLWTSHDELNHHERRYSKTQLEREIEDAGLALLESGYLFQSLVIPKALVRLREYVTTPGRSVPRVPARPLNAALRTFLLVEHAVARWVPVGTSLVAVATRRTHRPDSGSPEL